MTAAETRIPVTAPASYKAVLASPASVSMCPAQRRVAKDPLMISVTFFTFVFVVVVSLACAQPWNVPANTRDGRDQAECQDECQAAARRSARDLTKRGSEYDCVYTYTAFQPNMDFFKEKVAEITVDKCNNGAKKKKKRNKKSGRKKQRAEGAGKKSKKSAKKRGKSRKQKNKNRRKTKRPKTKSRSVTPRKREKKNRNRKKNKNKKVFKDLKMFRNWKRMMSQRRLMSEPAAQEAVADLWTGLLDRGTEWKQIFEDMHQHDQDQASASSISST